MPFNRTTWRVAWQTARIIGQRSCGRQIMFEDAGASENFTCYLARENAALGTVPASLVWWCEKSQLRDSTMTMQDGWRDTMLRRCRHQIRYNWIGGGA